MLRYKLRTLLILLAILPPLLWVGWTKYAAWKAERERRAALERLQAEERQKLATWLLVQYQWVNVAGGQVPQAPPASNNQPPQDNPAESPR